MKSPKTILSLPFAVLAIGAIGVLGLGTAGAQEWENTISKLRPAVAKAYVASVPSGFGANLNTGWYHKAPANKKIGFNVEGGIIAMATLLGSGKKTLNVPLAFTLDSGSAAHIAAGLDSTYSQSIRDSLAAALIRTPSDVRFQGPTILGSNRDTVYIYFSERSVTVNKTGTGDTVVNVKSDTISVRGASGLLGNMGGLMGALQAMPLFVPQLTLGTVMGTNVTLRWLPETQSLEQLGTVKLMGIGIQHNPAVWFEEKLPVDFGVGFFKQKLEVGDLMVANSWAIGLNASKTFGERFIGVTPYGGLQYENTTIDFTYDYRDMDGNEQPVKFSVDGQNKIRATVGVNVRVLAINLNTDVSIGKNPVGSFGMMVGI